MSDTDRLSDAGGRDGGTTTLLLVLSWLWVAVPLAWGVLETVRASMAFFR